MRFLSPEKYIWLTVKDAMHHHHHHHESSSERIGWAFFLNLCFTIIEFIGGVLTNSTAILADAVHDLGDSICLSTGLF